MKSNNIDDVRHPLTKEERAKGAATTNAKKKQKVQLREAFQVLLDTEITDKSGKTLSGNEALALKAFQAALKGDWRAWELVRDTSGQKPVDKVMFAEVEPEVISEVERIVLEEKESL